jgi:hypothetical protein
VTVLAEECDDGGGSEEDSFEVVDGFASRILSSSGFAMRNPPKDWDRLRSPFMIEL